MIEAKEFGGSFRWQEGKPFGRPVGRLTAQRFVAVVARAQREVLREFPQHRHVPVMPLGLDASVLDSETRLMAPSNWGEYHLAGEYAGYILIWQLAYEDMPDQENYYRQIKDVLRHEYRHVDGERHPDTHGNPPPAVEFIDSRHWYDQLVTPL